MNLSKTDILAWLSKYHVSLINLEQTRIKPGAALQTPFVIKSMIVNYSRPNGKSYIAQHFKNCYWLKELLRSKRVLFFDDGKEGLLSNSKPKYRKESKIFYLFRLSLNIHSRPGRSRGLNNLRGANQCQWFSYQEEDLIPKGLCRLVAVSRDVKVIQNISKKKQKIKI